MMMNVLFAATVVALTNAQVTVCFDERGTACSIAERATGRELASKSGVPFVAVGTKSAWQIAPASLSASDGGRRMAFSFPDPLGRVVLDVVPFDGGWTFEVAEFPTNRTVVAHLGCVAFDSALATYLGDRANAASDEKSAVSVRSYDLRSRMFIDRTHLWTQIAPEFALGSRFGLAAGPRSGFLGQMKAMTVASGAPHTTAGGAWAMEGGGAGASYLKAVATEESLDRWLELAERGGFGVVHFRESWYARRGHYDPNPRDWPRGLDGMRDAVARLHEHGILAGMHTLTGCIDFRDPWVAGPENADLLAWTTYTLAEPMTPDADVLVVNERPDGNHATVMTGSTRGNAIRIGNEIVQYSGVVREKPYRFTGVVRGAFGTKVAAHAKGDEAAYLQQMYEAFFPKPGSALAEKLVSAISNVYSTCGFDQIYCDGCEGMVSHYGMAWMRNRIVGACAAGGRPVINEDSVGGLDHSWWFHSRVGAWDDTFFAPKRFTDRHFEWVRNSPLRKADFLEPHMGWWSLACSPDYMRAHMVDDMEYFAMRTAGLDASMSVDWLPANKGPVSFHLSRQMTVLGWYEHARRAKAFAPETTALFCRKGVETRLRQDASGAWTVTPVVEKIHKFPSSAGNVWRPRLESDRVHFRLHALYSGLPYDDPGALTWLSPADIPALKISTAKDVTLALTAESDPEKGTVMAIRASNAGETSRGAWAVADQVFTPPRNIGGCRVIRVKVKGDGSGAVLNFQLDKPRHHGRAYSDHYVKVDFTGWREFELPVRERDAEDYDKYLWPYSGDYHNVYHAWLNFGAIGCFNLLVNEIPAHGTVDIRLADVRLTDQVPYTRSGQTLVVNGVEHEIPFEMGTGSFAEYADGVWTHYAPNGEPLARMPSVRPIVFAKGGNEIVYRGGRGRADLTPRAELDLFVAARPRPAFRARPVQGWGARMTYEAVEPMVYEPKKGFAELPAIRMRPGETAEVEAWVYGPAKPCVLALGEVLAEVPELAAGTRRLVRFTGRFTGSQPVTVRTDDPEARLRIEFAKRYCAVSRASSSGVFRIDAYGARTDGSNCREAIRRAVTAAAGGGRVVVPSGVWRTGAIRLTDGVELHLEKGAELVFSDDPADCLPQVETSWEGVERKAFSPLVYVPDATNVSITGEGTLRAEMANWRNRDLRPHFIQFYRCRNVRVEGVAVLGSPFWTIHLYRTDGATVRNVRVDAFGSDGKAIRNSDGIDVERSQNVLVEGCTFRQGDDAIVVKSGKDPSQAAAARPCENILIRDCTVTEGHVLLGIGSEVSCGVRNVLMTNCCVDAAVNRLFFIKTNPRRGGFVENVTMADVKAREVREDVVAVLTRYFYGQPGEEVLSDPRHTVIRGLTLNNVSVAKTKRGVNIAGDIVLPVRNVRITGLKTDIPPSAADVFLNAEDVRVDGVRMPCRMQERQNADF